MFEARGLIARRDGRWTDDEDDGVAQVDVLVELLVGRVRVLKLQGRGFTMTPPPKICHRLGRGDESNRDGGWTFLTADGRGQFAWSADTRAR